MIAKSTLVLPAILFIAISTIPVLCQSTEFTYQGSLKEGAGPANGDYDLEFALFDALSGGTQLGTTQTRLGVAVANGVFSVNLDFGSHFPGSGRYIEIRVRAAGGGAFTTLSPRQQINSSPYSIRSLSSESATTAATATNATQLGGLAASGFIQNTTTQQPASNFNISGTGSAGVFSAGTQFNIGADRILSAAGNNNLFAGLNAGQANSSGHGNAFFGNTAGQGNTTGFYNSFFGRGAGQANTTGRSNSFFGNGAGTSNTTGNNNSFIGSFAGQQNASGGQNAFFGFSSGNSNSAGNSNAFFGSETGNANTNGSRLTILGANADVGSESLSNATAIGSQALVSASNSLVLGSISGQNGASASTNVGIGISAPTERLHVVGNGLFTGNLTVNGSITGSVAASGITGILGSGNGGTGVSAPGASGNFLRSNGSAWTSSSLAPSDIPSGSTNYIQNQSAGVQASSNFNISGNGTANILNATTQYNLGGSRVLSAGGSANLFAGIGAGQGNTSGTFNAFFGTSAGYSNTTGEGNTFFGSTAGLSNSTGNYNSFFGAGVGRVNAGDGNSFFGISAGQNNTSGGFNAFFGTSAGYSNTAGNENSFFGSRAGFLNSTGTSNTFFGSYSGYANTTGPLNAFFGANAGDRNTTGANNTIIGAEADLTANNLTNATAIGWRAAVGASNSLVLGSINGVNLATASTNVGIGVTAPAQRLDVSGNVFFRGEGTINDAGGNGELQIGQRFASAGTPGSVTRMAMLPYGHTGGTWLFKARDDATNAYLDLYYSQSSGALSLDNNGRVGIGTTTPTTPLAVRGGNAWTSASWAGSVSLGNGSAIGWDVNGAGNRWGIGATNGGLHFFGTTSNFGTTASPANHFLIIKDSGVIQLTNLGAAGGSTLCRNPSLEISACSSSIRYKDNVASFSPGLDLVRKLRPVSFNWKDGGMADLGLVAEDVAAIEPLLTTTNAKGEVEGVKYDRISVVLINAIKQQQVQIDAQHKMLEAQKDQIDKQARILAEMREYLCMKTNDLPLCRPR